ncbi:MAG: DUF4476 domain-containing protein [Chitinophagaceae bacterium]|nr:DUF4476 domain-containing protein [Chitinophagaceae bacterium]
MKALFSVLAMAISLVAISQSTVTIKTEGNRNKQVIVDNKTYTIPTATSTSTTTTQSVVITDLLPGQHSLSVVRTNQTTSRNSAKSTFNLRDGYDLTLTVSNNGSVSTSETRNSRRGGNAGQLSTKNFNTLYTNTKNKTGASARSAYLEAEFNTSNTNRRITAQQASTLIQLVNSESMRLKLAKLVYSRVSDQQNFSSVANLLNSTNSRNDLNAYIAAQPSNTTDPTIPTTGTAQLTDAQFNTIYTEVIAEPTLSERNYYLNNFFTRDFNYYTSAQVKQLLQTISGEQERLSLAKSSYRGIVDRGNFNTIYSLLATTSSRSDLQAYINNYDGSNPMAAMTTANYDKLYQTVYYTNSNSSRNTAINNALLTAGNYFTAAQAKKLIALVSDEANRLQLSKNAYKTLVDRTNYTLLNDLLNSTASRNDLYAYVNNYNNVSVGATGSAMADADFNTLYRSVTGAWSSSNKVTIVSDAFRSTTAFFSTHQAKQLLTQITNENDRLVLAKSSYDNIVDPSNFTSVYDLFNTTSMRNDLAAFVSGVQNGTVTAKVAMSESEFKSIQRSLVLTFGLGAKYNSLTEIFNTETNYFTVAQAKELIKMVSNEGNRLELAKLSYNNITDPTNFSSVYDIFSSQASKNELAAYVEANVSR